jgi:bifunctional non-homologous end joining protein LigD
VEFSKAARGDRLFLDVMRNAYGQTEIAAYGLRGRAGAPIAAPLEWDEVRDSSLTADKWTVRNIFRRLARRTDPWVTIDQCARPLPRVR